jgi:UDP-glucose 4-epimerase
VLDTLSRGHRSSLPDSVPLVIGDTGDRDCLSRLFSANRFDAVMHFAAFAEVAESMLNPAKYFQNNSCATLTLRETCSGESCIEICFFLELRRFWLSDSIPILETTANDP